MTIKSDRPIYSRVKRKIVYGGLKPGEAVNVKLLGEDLNTSQIPIREALIALAAEDLIEFIPGRGFFTKALDLAEILGNFDLLSFLLSDAAEYIVSYPARREMLAEARASSKTEPGADLFDCVEDFADMLAQHYRRPHSTLLACALHRSVYILHADALLLGHDLVGWGTVYLDLLCWGKINVLSREAHYFWRERRVRLPQTLELAASMRPLAGMTN